MVDEVSKPIVPDKTHLSVEGPTEKELKACKYALLVSRPGGMIPGILTSVVMVDGIIDGKGFIRGWKKTKANVVVQFSTQLPYFMITSDKVVLLSNEEIRAELTKLSPEQPSSTEPTGQYL